MNCLEFRRAALADPQRLAAEAASHVEHCPACKDFLGRTLEMEARLAAAARIPAPPDLGARLLERGTTVRRSRWMALAASVVAAIAIALALGWPRSDPMALAGIDFVVFDEAQSIADAKPTDIQVLASVARTMGVSLPDQLGEIHYVCVYPFAAGAAHHVLLKSPLGKVTLLLIPERSIAARAGAAVHGLRAAVLPAAVGSIVIVGESARSIGRVETLLKSG